MWIVTQSQKHKKKKHIVNIAEQTLVNLGMQEVKG